MVKDRGFRVGCATAGRVESLSIAAWKLLCMLSLFFWIFSRVRLMPSHGDFGRAFLVGTISRLVAGRGEGVSRAEFKHGLGSSRGQSAVRKINV